MYMEILFLGIACVVIIILINNRILKAKAAKEERIRAAKAKAAEKERILKAKAKAKAAKEERIRAAKAKAAKEQRIRAAKAKAAKEERIRTAKAKAEAAKEERILQANAASPIRISGQLCPICGSLAVDVYKDGSGDCTSCRYTSAKHKNKMVSGSRGDLLEHSNLYDEKPERGWW
jgi:membrane protein involved in colicin uptake